MHERYWHHWAEEMHTIPTRTFKRLDELRGNIGTALVFGCGNSGFTRLVQRAFLEANVVGYDIDEDKIDHCNGYARLGVDLRARFGRHIYRKENPIHIKLEGIQYTSERPDSKFDVVLALAVLHEMPEHLADDALSFLNKQGHMVVIDYDMKDMPWDDFFDCWGYSRAERAEEQSIGEQAAYDLHTQFGLEDCIAIMQQRNMRTVHAEPKIDSRYIGGPKPTQHFLYIGEKVTL
ncbi:MAG: class I SAM-dependent methyltransferase [Nanoarchaeota archaeon]|nr:class I SAM-dependent methyltransferase [Nanoarchaeota archaeon]